MMNKLGGELVKKGRKKRAILKHRKENKRFSVFGHQANDVLRSACLIA